MSKRRLDACLERGRMPHLQQNLNEARRLFYVSRPSRGKEVRHSWKPCQIGTGTPTLWAVVSNWQWTLPGRNCRNRHGFKLLLTHRTTRKDSQALRLTVSPFFDVAVRLCTVWTLKQRSIFVHAYGELAGHTAWLEFQSEIGRMVSSRESDRVLVIVLLLSLMMTPNSNIVLVLLLLLLLLLLNA